MHLDNLLNHLSVQLPAIEFRNPDDLPPFSARSDKLLFELINPIVSCYADQIGEGASFPASVYEKMDSGYLSYAGFDLFTVDSFGLVIKAKTTAEINQIVTDIKQAVYDEQVPQTLIGIKIIGEENGYEPKRDLRIAALQFEMVTFNSISQALPAAYLCQAKQTATEITVTSNRQTHTHRFQVVTVSLATQVDANREAIRKELAGYHPDRWPVEYVDGDRAENIGRYAIWVETYQYQQILT